MRLEIPDDKALYLREFVKIGADKMLQDVMTDANMLIDAIDKACTSEPSGYDCVCEAECEGQSER